MLKRLQGFVERMAADRPVLLAFLIFLAATLVVVPLSLPVYGETPQTFFDNLLVEAHGFLFDLLIIGWFSVWLNRRAERRLRIRRYQEEIEDFLGWESIEAMHRLTGDIRRLSREGVSQINLRQAYLQGAYLVDIELAGAALHGATLSSAKLQNADFRGATMEKAQLELANATGADFHEANLRRANLTGAYLEDTNLAGTDLTGANLTGAFLRRANLAGANLSKATLKGIVLEEADLRGAYLEARQLHGARSLYHTRLEPSVSAALAQSHPHLFEAPDED